MTYTPQHRSLDQDRTLDAVISAAGPARTAILDLDGCLFDTRWRQVAILRAYAEQSGRFDVAAVEVGHFVDRDLATTLRRAGVPEADVSRVAREARALWEQRFFTPDHAAFDLPLPGAARLVRDLADRGEVVYLTGRTEDVRAATQAALHRFGFPEAMLVMKPGHDVADGVYKAEAAAQLRRERRASTLLENEPGQLNTLAAVFPEALPVWVETDCARPLPLVEGALHLHGFLRTDDP